MQCQVFYPHLRSFLHCLYIPNVFHDFFSSVMILSFTFSMFNFTAFILLVVAFSYSFGAK